MKRLFLPLLLLAGLLVAPATAQDPPAKPDFRNAPIGDVLMWAQKSIGCGFMYDGEVLRDPATGSQRTITAVHVEPATKAEKTVLLFELLRRCGLVAFEIGGLPGPTYQLYDAAGAARNAPLFDHPDELGSTLFAGLTIRLRRVSAVEVATRIKSRLTPGAGAVEVFETTHSLIVTDYADRLRAAWEVAQTAEQGVERADDVTAMDRALRVVPAPRALAALERLREKNETWKATAHETANVLLFSGRRDELDRLSERLRLLDRHDEVPAYAEETRTIKLIFIDPATAARTLREMFERELRAGSVQLGTHVDRQLVMRSSLYDYQRATEILKALDTPAPEKKAPGND